MDRARVLAPAVLVALAGCGAHVESPPLPTGAEWQAANTSLAALHGAEPDRPFGAVVQVRLREPRTGQTYSARGAIAVDPHHAFRMVLLGPGGTTALDVWATAERWRFELPAAGLLRRGGRDQDPALPIGFFRWWFLAPLEGRLLTSMATQVGTRFILRDGTATVDLVDRRTREGHVITASRRDSDRGGEDLLEFVGAGFAPTVGDRAVYDGVTSGVHAEVVVESLSEAPDALAFADPDAPRGTAAGEGRP